MHNAGTHLGGASGIGTIMIKFVYADATRSESFNFFIVRKTWWKNFAG